MSKWIFVIAVLAALAIAALLLLQDHAEPRSVIVATPDAQGFVFAASASVEPANLVPVEPTQLLSAGADSTGTATQRAPMPPEVALGERPLYVRFEDRVTGDSLGLFPVRVRRMSFPAAALQRAFRSRPNGILHLPRVKHDGMRVGPQPEGVWRTVQPLENGLLDLAPGLYEIGLLDEHLFQFDEGSARQGYHKPRLVAAGVEDRVLFRGVPSISLTVSIVNKHGAPVRDIMLPTGGFPRFPRLHQFGKTRPPVSWTSLGNGKFVADVFPGRLPVGGRSDSHYLKRTVEVRRESGEQYAEVVADSFPFDCRLNVDVAVQSPVNGGRYEAALASQGLASPIPGTEWRPLQQGTLEFNGLRAQEYSVVARELSPSGRSLVTNLGSTTVLDGMLNNARFSLEGRSDCVLFGTIEGDPVGLVAAFPLGVDLTSTPISSAVTSGISGFTLRLPRAGTYQLGFQGSRSWKLCGTFTVGHGAVQEQSFARPAGSIHLQHGGAPERPPDYWGRVLLRRTGSKTVYCEERLQSDGCVVSYLPAGTYDLSVEMPSHSTFVTPSSQSVQVLDGQATDVRIELERKD